MTASFAHVLGDRDIPPIVLDGGLASELERRGHDVSGALWSAQVLHDEPEAVRAVHATYFAAGAQVATSASYQATYSGYAAAGIDAAGTTALLRRSVELADQARRAADEADDAAGRARRPRWVAASVGPYGALLADGSEYRGDYGLDVEELRAFHRPRLQVLAQACVDIGDGVLACETIPCLAEVEALVAELDGLGVPAWISLTATGGTTRRGEPLAEAFALAASIPEVVGVGVNCCDPADVDLALAIGGDSVAGVPGVSLIAYPNTGELWDGAARAWTGEPALDASRVRGWHDEGARALGGCCRVGPALLAQMATALS